jgi:hypothetical protein
VLAAGKQNKAWDVTAALFRAQALGGDWVNPTVLKRLGGRIAGLKVSRFVNDARGPANYSSLNAIRNEAKSAGVTVTPAFVVRGPSGTKLVARPDSASAVIDAIKRQLDDQLAAARPLPDSETPALKAKLRKPVTLDFRDANLKAVFEALSRSTGINFVFDRDVKPDIKVTLSISNLSVEDVIGVLTVTNQLGVLAKVASEIADAGHELIAHATDMNATIASTVVEADERIGAHGELIEPLDAALLRAALQAAFDDGLRACAIVFMHGWRHGAHEAAAAALARDIGSPIGRPFGFFRWFDQSWRPSEIELVSK